ncbi:MAG: hypothetical protein IJJ74_07335 [Eubacterium sp.]|nr:hypothetical protein [Eubacterium sp.]
MTGCLTKKRVIISLRRYKSASDVLFCTGFFIYVVTLIMDLSMWTFAEDGGGNSTASAMKLIRYLAYAIMAVKIVYDFSVEYKNFKYLTVFAGVAGLALLTSKNTMIVFYFLVILAARGVSARMIISTALQAQGLTLSIAVLFSQIGLLVDYITDRSGRIRHFMGFQWATTSALIFLYMVFEYIYLKKGRINIPEFAIINIFSYYLYIMTDSRMSFLLVLASTLFFLAFGGVISKKRKPSFRRLFTWIIIAMPWIVAAASIYLHKIFIKGGSLDKLNVLLSNRLNYGHQAIDNYGISLLGKKMVWIGYGLNDTGKGTYNYVDCSYLRIAIEYGLIFLAMILFIYSLVIYKAYKNGRKDLVWITLFILLISVTESRLFNFAFNPFMLLAFSSLRKFEVTRKAQGSEV